VLAGIQWKQKSASKYRALFLGRSEQQVAWNDCCNFDEFYEFFPDLCSKSFFSLSVHWGFREGMPGKIPFSGMKFKVQKTGKSGENSVNWALGNTGKRRIF